MTATAPQVMYAHGPLTTPDGDLLWQLAAQQPASVPVRRAVTVRCLDSDGRDLTPAVVLSGPIGLDALTQIVGDATQGTVEAQRFARRAFEAMCHWQDVPGRGRWVMRRLGDLDRLALAAAGRDIAGVVTWATEEVA